MLPTSVRTSRHGRSPCSSLRPLQPRVSPALALLPCSHELGCFRMPLPLKPLHSRKLPKHVHLRTSLQSLELMEIGGIRPHRDSIYHLLQTCYRNRDIFLIRRLRRVISRSGLLLVSCFGDHLIRLFGSCGSLVEADQVFSEIPNRTLFTWNSIISMHAKFGKSETALQLFLKMTEDGMEPDCYMLSCLLKACGNLAAVQYGRLVHVQIIQNELETDPVLENGLIDMYAKCGTLNDSIKIFERLPTRDMVAWGTLIAGYAQQNESYVSLELLVRMVWKGLTPSKVTLLVAVKVCSTAASAIWGRTVHVQIIEGSFESDVVIGTTLIDMYAKCGCLDDAMSVFEHLQERNAVSWGALIAGHVQNGKNISGLKLFCRMQEEGIVANKVTFLSVLKACSNIGAPDLGSLIHHQIIICRLQIDLLLGSSLLDMYAKCGKIQEARLMFDRLTSPDIVSWGAMIDGYSQHGESILALELFERMQEQGIKASKASFLSVLKACSSEAATEVGQLIHDQIIKNDLYSDIMIASSLIDMYGKCGNLEESVRVFRRLSNPDAVSWGAVMAGFTQHGKGDFALQLFEEMQSRHVKADKFVFSCTLKACGINGSIIEGRLIHDQIIRSGMERDIVIGNSLVDMFSKCGSLQEAFQLFDSMSNKDAVSWGTMIGGYVLHGYGFSALEMFETMSRSHIKPDKIIFVSILTACGDVRTLRQGQLVHEEILQSGIELDEAIGNSLLDMYLKCGDLQKAQKVFDEWPNRDVVSWDIMISGYVERGLLENTIELFKKLQESQLSPNKAIFSSILRTCGSTGAVVRGKLIHHLIIEDGAEEDVAMGSSIVDMYAKCGSLYEAHRVLNNLSDCNVVAWGALIAGYAQGGNFILVRQCLEGMEQDGVPPNDTIFLNILTACSHIARLEDGIQFFRSMIEDYGIPQSTEHYSCMVDLFGRAGQLREANDLLCSMPLLLNDTASTSLLFSCQTHGNSCIGNATRS